MFNRDRNCPRCNVNHRIMGIKKHINILKKGDKAYLDGKIPCIVKATNQVLASISDGENEIVVFCYRLTSKFIHTYNMGKRIKEKKETSF